MPSISHSRVIPACGVSVVFSLSVLVALGVVVFMGVYIFVGVDVDVGVYVIVGYKENIGVSVSIGVCVARIARLVTGLSCLNLNMANTKTDVLIRPAMRIINTL